MSRNAGNRPELVPGLWRIIQVANNSVISKFR